MQQEYSVTEWICFATAHQPQSFADEAEYRNHMKDIHPGTFAPSELPELARMGRRSTFQVFDRCPFCDFLPDETKQLACEPKEQVSDTSGSVLLSHEAQGSLQRHIATHLEEIALCSVRWLDDDDGESITSSIRKEVEDLRRSGDIPMFKDLPVLDPEVDAYIDIDWKRVLPFSDILQDSPPLIPIESQGEFNWETWLDPYEGHQNDHELVPFVKRYNEYMKTREPPTLELGSKLMDAWIEWPPEQNSHFIPIDVLDNLIWEENVKLQLEANFPEMREQEVWSYVTAVCSRAKRLFALLVSCDKAECIWDKDLPFLRFSDVELSARSENALGRTPPQVTLYAASHIDCEKQDHEECAIKSIKFWRQRDIRSLDRDQWLVQAPVFESTAGSVPHLDLHDNVVLPFIEDHERQRNMRSGGYSNVWAVRIHHAHQKLIRPHSRLQVTSSFSLFILHGIY
jgi:hypothetical protein